MSALEGLKTHSCESGLSVVRRLLRCTLEKTKKKFDKRAIKYLVKKLREKLDELDYLVTAVTTYGANPGKCVTLSRTADGRLQISGCVTFPHLIYARMWRWTDLRNHWRELKHISNCKFPYNLHLEKICVNPYHYEKTEEISTFGLKSGIQRKKYLKFDIETADFYLYTPYNSFDNGPSKIFEEKYFCKPSEKNEQFWCSIVYYEFEAQLGMTFKVPKTHNNLQIVGYVDYPSVYSICLRSINNPTRNIRSERARLSIGKGISLELRDEGAVWMRVLSKHQVFIESSFLDIKTRHKSGEVTYKIYPSAVIKIFDPNLFNQKLLLTNKDIDSVLENLKKFCTMKISFNKGWGPGYLRTHVEETPCWIRIFMHEAYLQLKATLF